MRRICSLISVATLALATLATAAATAAATAPPAPPPGDVPAPATDATMRQIMIPPDECARMLADDGAALLRATTRGKLRRGLKLRLYAFRPGRTVVKVTARRAGRTITIARAEAGFAAPAVRTVRLRVTAAGRRELARRGRLVLRVRVTVNPAQEAAASASAYARI